MKDNTDYKFYHHHFSEFALTYSRKMGLSQELFQATFQQYIQLEQESNLIERNVNGLEIKLEKMSMIQVFAPSNLQPH